MGNKIAAVRGPIPVYVEDPVERLAVVREGMEGIKQSKQALGAEVISRFNDFAPPTLLAQAARVNFSTRLFNLVVTNVPGPQLPLYVLGRELQDIFPVGLPAAEPGPVRRDHELQRLRSTSGCSPTTTRSTTSTSLPAASSTRSPSCSTRPRRPRASASHGAREPAPA